MLLHKEYLTDCIKIRPVSVYLFMYRQSLKLLKIEKQVCYFFLNTVYVYTCLCVCVIWLVMAQNLSTSPSVSDRMAASKFAKTSLWLSVIGILLGVILLIVLLAVLVPYVDNVKHEIARECRLRGGHFNYASNTCRY